MIYTITMPKVRRLPQSDDTPPMKTVGYRLDEPTRGMLRAIMDHEDRSTESDTVRLLIRRAYRALPPEAQIVDTATRRDEPGM
jgi:hypothetical protein